MRKLYQLVLLCGVINFLSVSGIQAQDIQYSKDQLIGKWILKSASFNGDEVSLQDCKNCISFEFFRDGQVTLITSDGSKERGDFLLRGNKIIDPGVPEYLNVDILRLTKNDLVLEMQEEVHKVLMTFELAEGE